MLRSERDAEVFEGQGAFTRSRKNCAGALVTGALAVVETFVPCPWLTPLVLQRKRFVEDSTA